MMFRGKPFTVRRTTPDFSTLTIGAAESFGEYVVSHGPEKRPWSVAFRRQLREYRSFLAVLLACAAFNAVAPVLGRELVSITGFVLVLSALGGVVAGQASFFAVWAVFGPPPYKLRLALCVAAVETLYGTLLWGLVEIAREHIDLADVAGLAVLPLALACMIAPLWAANLALHYRLSSAGDAGAATQLSSQFGIRDVLAVTACVAFTAALAGVWLDWQAKTLGTPIALLTICILAALVSLLGALPCAWLLLRNELRLAFSEKVFLGYGIAAALVVVWSFGTPVNFRHYGSPAQYVARGFAQASPVQRFWIFYYVPAVAFLLTLFSALAIVRTCGHRLVPCRDSRQGTPILHR